MSTETTERTTPAVHGKTLDISSQCPTKVVVVVVVVFVVFVVVVVVVVGLFIFFFFFTK